MFKSNTDNHIRPEVQALADRGNVTLEEWENFRGNSWELELIASKLDDNAFVNHAEHVVKNCFFDESRPYRSYNEAAMGFVIPELIKRLKDRL